MGWLAAGSFRELAHTLHGAAYVFAGTLVAFVVLVWLAKRVLLRREARHRD